MPDETKFKTPPYIAYKTLMAFVDSFREHSGIPSRIDRSLLTTMSGTTQSQVLASLAFFGLVDDAGNTKPELNTLVHSAGEERAAILKDLVLKGYPYLTNGSINLKTATSKQVEDALKEATGVTGDTVRKTFLFFTSMAREAGLELSSFLGGGRTRNGGVRRRVRRAAQPVLVDPPELDGEDYHGDPLDMIVVPEGFIVHTFRLRKDLDIKLALPGDITAKDVNRLHRLMQVLPLDDDEAAS